MADEAVVGQTQQTPGIPGTVPAQPQPTESSQTMPATATSSQAPTQAPAASSAPQGGGQKKFFEYVSLDKDGKRVKGSMSAYTKEEVVQSVVSRGLSIISIDEVSGLFSLERLKEINIGGVPLDEKVIFMKQIAIMINAGLSVTRALEVLSFQAQNPRFKAVLKESYKLVSGGVSLSDAFGKFPDAFDSIAVSLIRAGEQSGNLDKIFRKLATEYQNRKQLQGKIQGALAYPAVITTLMVGVVIFLMLFVVPQLQQAFEEFGAELPLITKIVIGLSNILIHYWYIVIVLIVSIVVAFRYFISTPQGDRLWQKMWITIPVFGPLNVKIQTANFARILYLLISSGVPILQGLDLTEAAMTNIWFKDEVADMREQVKRGIPIAQPLMQSANFPLILGYMVNVGQETGKLDEVLKKVSKYYDIEIKAASKALSTILEPILLIVMGVVVGGIVVAVYLPMFQLTQQIQ
ncbi:MAG: type II secretion system F family protein [Candidatus Dojkabacteria bacterium]|nr:MAG: type II secretion system F family protein [Candidatus Dojkabacteria bacterium]